MIRATTPIHFFIFEEDPSEFLEMSIVYKQKSSIVLEKHKKDVSVNQVLTENDEPEQWAAWYKLTQEETKLFSAPGFAKIQVKVFTKEGQALAGKIFTIPVNDVLSDEVMKI